MTNSEELIGRPCLKCDGTRAETRFHLSAKRMSPFKSAEASVQSTTGSQGVRISGSNSGYTMFRSSVKGVGYPLHSTVSPSLPVPCEITFQLHSNTANSETSIQVGARTVCDVRSVGDRGPPASKVITQCTVSCRWNFPMVR